MRSGCLGPTLGLLSTCCVTFNQGLGTSLAFGFLITKNGAHSRAWVTGLRGSSEGFKCSVKAGCWNSSYDYQKEDLLTAQLPEERPSVATLLTCESEVSPSTAGTPSSPARKVVVGVKGDNKRWAPRKGLASVYQR